MVAAARSRLISASSRAHSFSASRRATAAADVVATVNVDQLGLATVPVLNLSPDGDTAYFIAGDANTELWACASIGSAPCYDRGVGGQLVFKTTLPGGPYAIAQPLGNHLVVASAQQVLFTNPNGTPQGTATLPTGGLSVLNIVPGQGDQFYVLDGDRNGNLLEVVMLVGPGQEAARFHVDTGAIGVDYDQSYTPYLLVNGTLSKLLSPDQYWAARQ